MVSQGGTGSGISGPSVEKIYEALYGVTGPDTVDPKKALMTGAADQAAEDQHRGAPDPRADAPDPAGRGTLTSRTSPAPSSSSSRSRTAPPSAARIRRRRSGSGKGLVVPSTSARVRYVAVEVAMTAGYPPYAPPRPSSRRTGVFSRESVLWRLDWILILAIAGLCFIGSLLIYSATRVKLADAGLDPMSELKKHILNIAIGVCLAAFVTLVRPSDAACATRRSSTSRPCSACSRCSRRWARASTARTRGSCCLPASRCSRRSSPRWRCASASR